MNMDEAAGSRASVQPIKHCWSKLNGKDSVKITLAPDQLLELLTWGSRARQEGSSPGCHEWDEAEAVESRSRWQEETPVPRTGQDYPGPGCISTGLHSHVKGSTAHPGHTPSLPPSSFFPFSLVFPFLLFLAGCLQGSSNTFTSLTSSLPSWSPVPTHLHITILAPQVPQHCLL